MLYAVGVPSAQYNSGLKYVSENNHSDCPGVNVYFMKFCDAESYFDHSWYIAPLGVIWFMSTLKSAVSNDDGIFNVVTYSP